MSGLLVLAERCEAAEAGSFTLDKEILAALGYTWRGMDYWYRDDSHTWPGMAALTRSLDAAMTLVLEGYVVGSLKQRTRYEIVEAKNNSVDLSEQAAWSAWVHKDTNDRTFRVGLRFSHHGAAATPALALCAAALRAREQS